ncbi:hypothetical protein IWX49DRAFT_366941 [Phyllosticta citricarpa]|uniref:Secreted protein n=2 Tax=Phyllosticta TaxID=121621 RepID=A0ABR1MJ99_9PEZI
MRKERVGDFTARPRCTWEVWTSLTLCALCSLAIDAFCACQPTGTRSSSVPSGTTPPSVTLSFTPPSCPCGERGLPCLETTDAWSTKALLFRSKFLIRFGRLVAPFFAPTYTRKCVALHSPMALTWKHELMGETTTTTMMEQQKTARELLTICDKAVPSPAVAMHPKHLSRTVVIPTPR